MMEAFISTDGQQYRCLLAQPRSNPQRHYAQAQLETQVQFRAHYTACQSELFVYHPERYRDGGTRTNLVVKKKIAELELFCGLEAKTSYGDVPVLRNLLATLISTIAVFVVLLGTFCSALFV
ncbi:MAG: hypothetical protein GPOALKHO_000192 [Sodalis sp.]|nr:MAG: hypothetical protein GPOALKHO_000192 [Sodalis sp.]